jgi:hypothetical protein
MGSDNRQLRDREVGGTLNHRGAANAAAARGDA